MSAVGTAVGTTAKSYGQILGSNDRLNFAVIGLNGRAYAHLASLKANKSAARISHVCDVDGDILKKFADKTQQEMGEEGRVPPTLTGVGAKLNENYLRHILNDGAHDRPYVNTRMPKFGAGNADDFARAADTDYYAETSVGEFLLGSKK